MKTQTKISESDLKTLQSWLKRPSDYGYYGDKDMFETWGHLPWGCTTRDDRDSMAISNQSVTVDMLEKINKNNVELQNASHWVCGWVCQIAIKVFHNGKPTKVALEALKIAKLLEEYPLIDDSDYSERESEAEQEDLEYYLDDFKEAILKYFKLEEQSKNISDKELKSLAGDIYREDCGYRGREDAFVNSESIVRFLKEKYLVRDHEKTIEKLMKGNE